MLNKINRIVPLVLGITWGAFYFLKNDIQSFGAVLLGVFFTLLVFVGLFVATFCAIWLVCLFSSFTINTKKEYTKVNRFYRFMLNLYFRYMLDFFGIKFTACGQEKLPTDRRFLTVCNHRSNFDNMVQALAFKKFDISFIAKKELFKFRPVKQYMARNLYLGLDRKDIRQGLNVILKAISYIKDDVINMGVYPEGTRAKDGKIKKFNPGCLKIALKANCPIVVCTIQGTENFSKNFPFKKTLVQFNVIKVIEPNDFAGKTSVELADEIRNLMIEYIGE